MTELQKQWALVIGGCLSWLACGIILGLTIGHHLWATR